MNNDNYFEESSEAIKNISKETAFLKKVLDLITLTLNNNNKILIAGNGGSNSDAEHFVGELVCTFNNKKRKPLSAIHLGSNSTAITAWGNDFNFETYIEREVKALGNINDLLILISTGGGDINNKTSTNMILANKMAKKIGMKTLALVGKNGGYLIENSDVSIHIKNHTTSIIQECHIAVIHYLCYGLDNIYK